MEEIKFAGKLTESEFRQIQYLAQRKIWLIISVFLIVLVSYMLLRENWENFSENLVEILLTWMPLVIFLPFLFIYRRYMIRRHWRKNQAIQQPVAGSISEEGISWNVQGLSSAKIPWHLLLKYRASNSLILIYQSLNQVYYFPRRYFMDDTEWDMFLEFLSTKLPRK